MSEDKRKKIYVRATPAALRARDLLLARVCATDLAGMPSLEEMTPALWMWLVNEDAGAIARGIAPHVEAIRAEVAAKPQSAPAEPGIRVNGDYPPTSGGSTGKGKRPRRAN